MKSCHRLVLRDLAIGLGPVVVPGRLLLDVFEPWYALGIVANVLLFAAVQYVNERRGFPDWLYDLQNRPLVILTIAAVALPVLLSPVLLVPEVAPWYLAAFVGMGMGLILYRIAFGIVLPVPEPARAQVRDFG